MPFFPLTTHGSPLCWQGGRRFQIKSNPCNLIRPLGQPSSVWSALPWLSKAAEVQMWMATWPGLQMGSTLAMCSGCAAIVLLSPKVEVLIESLALKLHPHLHQRCNSSTAQQPQLALPWGVCSRDSKPLSPWSTRFACLLLTGTTCIHKTSPSAVGGDESGVAIWHFRASSWTGADC